MRRVFLFLGITILFFGGDILAQNNSKKYSETLNIVDKYLENDNIHEAILNLDDLTEIYYNESEIYFQRAILEFLIGDIYSAREDLLKVNQLGKEFSYPFFKLLMNNEDIILSLIDEYDDISLYSKENNYRKVYTLKDSLRGGIKPESTCYDAYYYNLTVKIIPETKSIAGYNDIYINLIDNSNSIQIDLAENLSVESLSFDDKPVKFERIYDAVFLHLDNPDIGKHCISIKYSGIPVEAKNPPWNGGFVWEKKKRKHWVGVACEHLGASSWWPCKESLHDKPDSMTINIQVPEDYMAVSNGNLQEVKCAGDGYKSFKWFVSYPINNYCVTFYMGQFVNFNEIYESENGKCAIDYYVLKHNLRKAKKFYEQTTDILEVYENLFGPYPYQDDGVAMVESPFAGMEHQSAIAIGAEYGASDHTYYYLNQNEYDYLVVHEFAHEWWGNTVAFNDMADAWLSEAFATYSEHLFIEAIYGHDSYLDVVAENMFFILNIWPLIGNRGVNDNTFLGNDIYNKGAAMLHNLRCIVNNDSLFFQYISDYFNHFKFQPIETNDFISFTNNYFDQELLPFFKKFLYDAEPPVLEYSYYRDGDKFILSYHWINVEDGFIMPFSVQFNGNENIRLVGTTELQELKLKNVQKFFIMKDYLFGYEKIEKNSLTYFWTSWKR